MNTSAQQPKIKCLGIDYEGNIMSMEQLRILIRLSNKYDLSFCDKSPDIIFLFTASAKSYANYEKALVLRKKYGFSTFIVGVTGEPPNHQLPEFDFSISYMPDSTTNYYYPNIDCGNIVENISKIRKLRSKEKSAFCNFIYSNESNRYPGAIARIKFCKMLSKYKRIDCAGKVLNNTNELRKMESNKDRSGKYYATINFMSNYKFSISFENSIIPGYFTEKIINAFMARTIPIYYGAEDITDYFNPAAFVNCHDYDKFSDVIERVKEIDQNPKLFSRYMNANPIHETSKLYQYNNTHIRTDMIIHKAIQKKEKYAYLQYPLVHETAAWFKIIGSHLPWVVYLNFRYYRIQVIKYYSKRVKKWIYPIKYS